MGNKNKQVRTIHIAGSVWVSILENAIGIVITFVILWTLSIDLYGFVKVTEGTVGTVYIFSNLGLTIALTHFATSSLEKESIDALTYLLAASLVIVLAYFVITLLTPLILIVLSLESYFGLEYLLCSGGFLFTSLTLLTQNFLKGVHEYTWSLYARVLQTVTRFVVIPLSFILSALGYFIGTFFAGLLAFALSLTYIVKSSRNLSLSLEIEQGKMKQALSNLLNYGKKSFISKLMRQLYFTAPIWILAGISEVSVALFSVAFLLTSLIQLFPAAIRGYMMPSFTRYLLDEDYKKAESFYRQGTGAVLSITIPINLTMAFFPEAVIWLLRPSYLAAVPHILPLALVNIIYCIWTFDAVMFYSAGAVEYSVVTEMIIAFISILTTLILIPLLGDLSPSWGLLLAFLIGWLVQHILLKRNYKVSSGFWLTSRTIFLIAITIAINLLQAFIQVALGLQSSILVSILFAASGLMISGLASILLSLVPKDRIMELLRVVLKQDKNS